MIEFIDKTSTQNGTDINRANMMNIQGFSNETISFSSGTNTKTITIVNSDGDIYTGTFSADGTIIEKYVGDKTLTKTSTFNSDGTITGVLS